MAEGLSIATWQSIFAAMLRGRSYVETAMFMQVHLGPPGPDGTDNPCVETTRIDILDSYDSDADETITIANDDPIGPWPVGTAAENPTHCSFWSEDYPDGTFITSGEIAGLDGDEMIPAGGLTFVAPPPS